MDINLIIIISFLVTTLIIGIYCGRGVCTFKDYAVGNRQMSTWVITISLMATIYGSRFLYAVLSGYYRRGLYAIIRDLIAPLFMFYLTSRFLSIRMKEFLRDYSIAESMGKLYGPVVRIVTAVLGIIVAISVLLLQFKHGLSVILASPLFKIAPYPPIYYAIILALLTIIYSTFGGARSVAWTDVYQFFIFGVCFPIITFLLLYHVQDPWTNWRRSSSVAQFFNLYQGDHLHMLTYVACYSIFTFDPAQIQRFYMCPSVQQAAKVFSRSAIIRIGMAFSFLLVIIALHIGGHLIDSKENVLDYIINLAYFPGMQGLLITTIIALLMSTADSYLHTASILFANDLWPFLVNTTKQSHTSILKVARYFSLLIGITTSFMMLYYIDNTIPFRSFYTPAVTVPMIVACFGFRPKTTAVLFTMGINLVLTTYYTCIKGQTITEQGLLKSFIYTTLLLFITHYLLPRQKSKGWVGIKDDNPVQLQNQETKRWWLSKVKSIKAVFTKFYWANIFPKDDSTFIALGIYLIVYSTISLFYMQKAYSLLYMYFYINVMVIGTLIAFYPILKGYKKVGIYLLYILWPILLYMTLFISAIIFFKLSHFSPNVCAFFMVNVGLGSLLLPYTILIVMLATVLFFHGWIPPHVALVSCKEWITTETVVGLTILVSCLGYRYIRNKANIQLQTIALTRSYEQKYMLTSLYNQANWNRLDPTYSGKVLQDIADALGPYVGNLPIQQHQKKLYLFSQSLLKRAKEERTFALDSKAICKVDLEDLILKSYEAVRKLDIPIRLLVKKQTKEKYLLAEPTIFERLFTINFWNLCQDKHTLDHTVSLTISDTLLSYPFPKPYQVATGSTYEKQLSSPILSALAFSISTHTDRLQLLPTYVVTDETASGYLPKTINNLYQEESRQILQAHGGYIQTIETETSLTCLYILPIDGRKVMRFKRYHTDDLFNKVAETAISLAQEKELISLLVNKTTLTDQKVQATINFIKKAHGATMRKSGEPYYTHPMEVAKIVLEATKHADTILAALLHDVVEDTMVTLEQIKLLYGIEVAYIVDMVTHYNTYGYRWKLDNSENLIILNQCKDIRVIQIKLADRLHNLRTIAVRKLADQKRIAKETMDFYIPWSRKNNILTWLSEMESICEQILHTNPVH
ncbi:MAG: HD domain-containing protein [Candidatus Cardinium sp.]|nr:HD domain-containing protein [Candidatus Cardinium sp.]